MKNLIKVISMSLLGIAPLFLANIISNIYYNLMGNGIIPNVLCSITYVIVTYLLLKLIITKFLKQPLNSFLMTKFKLKKEWVLMGILLPVSIIFIMSITLKGELYFNKNVDYINIIIGIFMGMAAGIVEELIFRGFIMNYIKSKYGVFIGILLSSILFGALHIQGAYNYTSMILLLVGGTLVGTMFSVMANYHHTIWASITLHTIWNAIMFENIFSIGTTINDRSIAGYLVKTNNTLLTGGDYGKDVSIFAIIGYSVVILFIICQFKKRNSINNVN
ncbi:CPBP family intramembrane glutamic endopeptidase [Vagococcus xieshaowenii]|uniref:CPBP family intramembrane metalloprotease n=1 Tax=Vagococcus xieshaowenii TaxID=2562451 RepID=A0AAJ5JQ84_9ENTE|nr:type II CAAX endopeptidase family protein [Vagococcus xieshaowenii]QCA28153.1 CPBP family intramembrane metalloprotease [Vagococcus xieshaowenii]TFZ39721.1 CPBP family intramembrane metalloprotease [Vagococcus xieshaowenii]